MRSNTILTDIDRIIQNESTYLHDAPCPIHLIQFPNTILSSRHENGLAYGEGSSEGYCGTVARSNLGVGKYVHDIPANGYKGHPHSRIMKIIPQCKR